ncbi:MULTISPECIES: transcriptional regulator FtrA [Azospirillum]|uniref:Transcriptional regulator FtrA n=1 Tax=Azospirillum lipoferum TaxID=193 RepID=A0A5A9GY62_AZOLI|nr:MULTISPECIES: transcriptional regulator FtrA [Azospirillum]KAA0598712.1 transcriptional regulator FtrA [Azospirillum lipoferum]MDW5535426.1 transcriptional regulator FtrA [Azospirillum sp. NL1]
MPKSSPPLVVTLAYDGLCTFEFGVAVEVFGLPRPELGPDWYRFAVAALDPGPLRAMGGIRVEADGGIDLLDQADIIVVPGWRGAREPAPERLVAALRRADARGARILSICSGAFVLAAAGLLSGRRATTHWRYASMLTDLYPDIQVVPDVLYVDEGNILTSAGSAAGIDLCLHLVRRDFGPEAANSVARRLVVQPHREGGQAQFIEAPVPTAREGARLAPLLDHLRETLVEDHSLSSMASRAGMSLRTFLRRFQAMTGTTPGEWLLMERLTRARDLLERSSLPVEEVATLTGFGSAATLRHHFRQRLGLSPANYRARFRQLPVSDPATSKKGAVVTGRAPLQDL